MVEFALAGTGTMLLFISTIQLSLGMWNYHTLAYGVHEATRYVFDPRQGLHRDRVHLQDHGRNDRLQNKDTYGRRSGQLCDRDPHYAERRRHHVQSAEHLLRQHDGLASREQQR